MFLLPFSMESGDSLSMEVSSLPIESTHFLSRRSPGQMKRDFSMVPSETFLSANSTSFRIASPAE